MPKPKDTSRRKEEITFNSPTNKGMEPRVQMSPKTRGSSTTGSVLISRKPINKTARIKAKVINPDRVKSDRIKSYWSR